MHSTNTVYIYSDLDTVFGLAANVEVWARILPHYRYVKLLHQDGPRKWVEMSAWRDLVPVTWTAIQTVTPGQNGHVPSITFQHIRGLVRGMEVEWWFKSVMGGAGLQVGITHHLDQPPFPTSILGPRLFDKVVAEGFIGNIAGKTLLRMKELAEGSALVPTSDLYSEPYRVNLKL